MENIRASLLWKPKTLFSSIFFFFTLLPQLSQQLFRSNTEKKNIKKKPLETTVSNVGSIATYRDIELLEKRLQLLWMRIILHHCECQNGCLFVTREAMTEWAASLIIRLVPPIIDLAKKKEGSYTNYKCRPGSGCNFECNTRSEVGRTC